MTGSWVIERRASPLTATIFAFAGLLAWLFVFAVFGGVIQASMAGSWLSGVISYISLCGFVALFAAWITACFSRLCINCDENARRITKQTLVFGTPVVRRLWEDVDIDVAYKAAHDRSSEGSRGETRYVTISVRSVVGEQRVLGWFGSVLFGVDHFVVDEAIGNRTR
jgi:hypothetical protein